MVLLRLFVRRCVIALSALVLGPTFGDVCPAGSYCPEGTDEPIACPAGTFNPDLGGMALSDCLDCTGGFHCNTTGKVSTVTPQVRASTVTPQVRCRL